MKLDITDNYNFILEDLFNPIILKSSNDKIIIISRDNGFEITYNNIIYEFKNGIVKKLT